MGMFFSHAFPRAFRHGGLCFLLDGDPSSRVSSLSFLFCFLFRLMRWKDHLFDPAQVDQIWADRRDGYLIIDMEFMPNKLWVAVPDLA